MYSHPNSILFRERQIFLREHDEDTNMPQNGTENQVLQTTEISLTILETIHNSGGATLTELADQLGIATSTAHNHLNTLYQNGYLVKEGNEYHLALRFFELGQSVVNRKKEYQIAKEKIIDLTQRTDAIADFSVEEHGRIVSLFSDLHYENESAFFRGRGFHMHCSAAGKAILCEFSKSRIRDVIEEWGLPRRTENTIVEERELFRELERTRERGYAINNEEQRLGLLSIGVAVTYPDDSVFGAISIDLPTYWTEQKEDFEDLEADLLKSGEELERDVASLYTGNS